VVLAGAIIALLVWRSQRTQARAAALPNRRLFAEHLQTALARAVRRREPVFVLYLDLDDFKVVNDSLGHQTGDRLLLAVAERLRGCLRPGDTAARMGGDEFTVLLADVSMAEDAVGVADRLANELRAPFLLDGNEVVACCAAPTSPCTTPRSAAKANTGCSSRRWTPSPPSACGWSPRCARPCANRHSGSTSSRSSTSTRASSPSWRRWCAGTIPGRG
jgi:diguanylate cyclase (GGDEF)-like protein